MAIMQECPVCRTKQSNKKRVCKCGEDLNKAKRSKRVRYWITYRLPGGKQRREAVGFSIEDARAAEGKRKAEKKENPRVLKKSPEETMTFEDLAKWYLALPKVKGLKSFWRIEMNLNTFNETFGKTKIKNITALDLEKFQVDGLAQGFKKRTRGSKEEKKEGGASQPASQAYIDQILTVARTMINRAFDSDIVSGETVKVFRRVKNLQGGNANARDRVLTHDEFERIMANLPAHARPVIATAYYTGMRSGEIFPLTWDKVDLKERVIRLEAADTKDKEPRVVPICNELFEVLSGLPRPIHTNNVFLKKGEPIKKLRNSLSTAAKKANIPFGRKVKNGFTFHDFRHTFNTNMRRAGVPESVIMKITGHSTRAMFDRYNTVDADDAKNAVNIMSSFLQPVDQSVDQDRKRG
ncbi:integrase family protein [Desulfatibacillum aliphaticivorans]|uniref:Integrase family protein n=1 Tax=Desulfatibacillum aliphaticivorans TaxID=218208 RepID=B8FKX9_DESAL|nr:site-specific integrase [Desulfatibacillum aliphaticivorans]ACL04501.1 integrase family protein [Desulfatibacillum aliphaticivorans]